MKEVSKAELEEEKRQQKEMQRKEEERAKRAKELKGQLFDAEQKNYLDSLTKEQKILELQRRRQELLAFVQKNFGQMDEENRLKAQIDLEKNLGEEKELQRGLDADKNKKQSTKLDVNSLQKIGAYVSNPEATVHLQVAQKSEQHLYKIEQHLARMSGTPSTSY